MNYTAAGKSRGKEKNMSSISPPPRKPYALLITCLLLGGALFCLLLSLTLVYGAGLKKGHENGYEYGKKEGIVKGALTAQQLICYDLQDHDSPTKSLDYSIGVYRCFTRQFDFAQKVFQY